MRDALWWGRFRHDDGDVYLTFASGNESFVSLETTAVENPNIGEIVYKFGGVSRKHYRCPQTL